MTNWRDHITVDPEICHGKACFRGARVLVSAVLDNIAAGESEEAVLESYPSLTRDSITAAIAFATDLARERVIALPS
jgi:uncharacterized protein (DUF433 family)